MIQFFVWDEADKRYRTHGDFPQVSDIIRLDVTALVKGGGAQGLLPAGFKGPVRPKGFTVLSGAAGAVFNEFNVPTHTGGKFANAFVKGSGSVPDSKVGIANAGTGEITVDRIHWFV